jgi:hypothetical protein
MAGRQATIGTIANQQGVDQANMIGGIASGAANIIGAFGEPKKKEDINAK